MGENYQVAVQVASAPLRVTLEPAPVPVQSPDQTGMVALDGVAVRATVAPSVNVAVHVAVAPSVPAGGTAAATVAVHVCSCPVGGEKLLLLMLTT